MLPIFANSLTTICVVIHANDDNYLRGLRLLSYAQSGNASCSPDGHEFQIFFNKLNQCSAKHDCSHFNFMHFHKNLENRGENGETLIHFFIVSLDLIYLFSIFESIF